MLSNIINLIKNKYDYGILSIIPILCGCTNTSDEDLIAMLVMVMVFSTITVLPKSKKIGYLIVALSSYHACSIEHINTTSLPKHEPIATQLGMVEVYSILGISNQDMTTTTTEDEEPPCVELTQPKLKYKIEYPLMEEKSLIELKCRGPSSYRQPTERTDYFQGVLDVNTGLVSKLADRGLLLKWSKKLFSKELKEDTHDMCNANNNGVYYNNSLKKCGFGRRSCTTKSTRYPNDDVKLISDVDKFEEEDLEMMHDHLREVFNAIPDYPNDFKDITLGDLKTYENKYGISPFTKFFLDRVLNHGGGNVQGILKVIYSMLIESAVQEYWKERPDGRDNGDDQPTCRSKYSIHEWLHYGCESVKHTHERVEEYLEKVYEPSMCEFYKMPTNKMNYMEKIASVSWEPRHTMRQEKLHERPTEEDIINTVKELVEAEQVYDASSDTTRDHDRDGIAIRMEETFGIELSSQDVSTILNGNNQRIISIIKNKISSLEETSAGKAVIIHVTHGLYDRCFSVWGSKEKNKWEDPIPCKEDSNGKQHN